jgi:hypothetical protein
MNSESSFTAPFNPLAVIGGKIYRTAMSQAIGDCREKRSSDDPIRDFRPTTRN